MFLNYVKEFERILNMSILKLFVNVALILMTALVMELGVGTSPELVSRATDYRFALEFHRKSQSRAMGNTADT